MDITVLASLVVDGIIVCFVNACITVGLPIRIAITLVMIAFLSVAVFIFSKL